MISPTIIKNFLPKYEFKLIQNYYKNFDKNKLIFNADFNRYEINGEEVSFKLLNSKTNQAREIFKSDTLLPTYSFFVEYFGNASLMKHKDMNACTYTLDLCLYQTEPWDLWIEGKNYTLLENEALAYYGEAQEHWREKIPNPESQVISMIFLHYAEPNHWYFKKMLEK